MKSNGYQFIRIHLWYLLSYTMHLESTLMQWVCNIHVPCHWMKMEGGHRYGRKFQSMDMVLRPYFVVVFYPILQEGIFPALSIVLFTNHTRRRGPAQVAGPWSIAKLQRCLFDRGKTRCWLSKAVRPSTNWNIFICSLLKTSLGSEHNRWIDRLFPPTW